MVAVVLELLGEVEESFTLRVDVQLAVNNPAGVGAVLNCVPDITVTGDNGIALFLQSGSSFEELIPALGAGADRLSDDSGIIRTENILSDGATINEGTTGGLIAKADNLAVGRTSADLNGVGSDLSLFDRGIDVNAKIFIGGSKLSHVALRILQDERSLCAVQIRSIGTAGSQSLVQSGLIKTIGRSYDGGIDFILVCKIGVRLNITVDHVGNFVREGHYIDNGLSVCKRCRSAEAAQREYHYQGHEQC